MIPQLFHIGPFPINSFGLMVASALLVVIYLLPRSFSRNGIDPRMAERYVLVGGIVGLLGARIWYLVEEYEHLRGQLLEAFFASAGFTFYGGFIISAVVLIAMSRRDGIKLSALCDSLGPSLALGYAVGRLGCQLSGDGCYGIATESIFGMSYAHGVVPTPAGISVFPTPLYESILSVIIAVLLIRLEKSPGWQAPFQRFAAYLLLAAPARFAIEFLRHNPSVFGALSQAQVIALLIFVIGALLLLYSRRRYRDYSRDSVRS